MDDIFFKSQDCLIAKSSYFYGTTEKPVIVGCIDVVPGSEKLCFLSNLTSSTLGHDRQQQSGMYWRRHVLGNAVVCDKPRNVNVYDSMDTSFFNADETSKTLLDFMLIGIPEFTELYLDRDISCINPSCKLDHFVIAVNARALFTGLSYFWSFLFGAHASKEEKDQMEEVARLYEYIADILTLLLAKSIFTTCPTVLVVLPTIVLLSIKLLELFSVKI